MSKLILLSLICLVSLVAVADALTRHNGAKSDGTRFGRAHLSKVQVSAKDPDGYLEYCRIFNRNPLKRALCFIKYLRDQDSHQKSHFSRTDSYPTPVINHKDCDTCLMESAGLKKVLTEDYLASLIHNNTRVCLQIDEQIEAENCLVGVAQDQWELRVLLTHTISSFCQWIEACHGGMYATSEPKLPKHSQVIQVKRPAPSYLDDGPDQECDQCLLLAAQVRRNMSADLITQVTSVQRKLCLRKTEEQQLHLCLDQTAYFKDLLNHLLGNAVQDYCPWANLCRQE